MSNRKQIPTREQFVKKMMKLTYKIASETGREPIEVAREMKWKLEEKRLRRNKEMAEEDGKYLSQFHKESSERKMKQIEEWRKSPTDIETAIANQRKREQIVKEMEDQKRTNRNKRGGC